jgi:hypothetical protein
MEVRGKGSDHCCEPRRHTQRVEAQKPASGPRSARAGCPHPEEIEFSGQPSQRIEQSAIVAAGYDTDLIDV